MTKPQVLLRFDTEDYVTPGSNTALYDVLEMLQDLKIKATFCLVGEKISQLVNEGEHTILDMLQHHALGYHSYLHSFHPLAMEYLEGHSWGEGVREFLQAEDHGHKIFVEIFDQPPICYTQPGADWVPHTYIALQQWEVPLFFSDAKYALLNYPEQPFIVNGILTLTSDHAGTALTSLASTPSNRENILQRFADQYQLASQRSEAGFITLVCHPERLITAGTTPWDVLQFANGQNTPRENWQAPPLKDRETYEADLQALRDLLTFLSSRYELNWITAQDLVDIYQNRIIHKDRVVDSLAQQATATNQARTIDFAQIQVIARAFTQQISCIQAGEHWLSPVQAASLLCQTLLIRAHEGYFPRVVPMPSEIFFPEDIPTAAVNDSLDRLGWTELVRGATEFLRQVKQDASFPLKIKVGGNLWLSLCRFIGGVAQAIVTMSVDNLPQDRVLLPSTHLQTADYVKKIDQVQWTWPIFRYGYRNGQILEDTALLSWTLKPVR